MASSKMKQGATGVAATLAGRGKNYGKFSGQSQVAQDLKNCMRSHLAARDKELVASQQEALEMIFHKIARIVNGNENFADSWHDIAGYASLIDEQLQGNDI